MRSPAERYAWASACLEKSGTRFTRQRQLILSALAHRKSPVTLEALARELPGAGNLTTLYRAMHCFQKTGVVRQVHLAGRSACYVLIAPGEHCDFLVCNDCGSVNDLPELKPILELEKRIAARSGFRALQHEVEFYGICPDCQRDARPAPSTACK